MDYRRMTLGAETDLFSVRNLYADGTLGEQYIRGFTALGVATDKISAVLSPTRVKTRDVFDLWFLFHRGYVDPEVAWWEFVDRHARPGAVSRGDVLDLISEGIDGYREDWGESTWRGVYPPALTTFEQFQDMAMEVAMLLGDA